MLLRNLCGILLRFRLYKTAMVADIEKAFLQIGLQPSQRDVTRFLWLNNLDSSKSGSCTEISFLPSTIRSNLKVKR